MAQVQPAQLPRDTPASERKVFERLRDALPDDWLVVHSRRVVTSASEKAPRAYEGEADFLVFHSKWGMLGLEVKGGQIARDGTRWFSRDRSGTVHEISDPGRQAQRAVHSLVRYLREHPKSRMAARSLFYGWAVVFPDVEVSADLGPDLPRSLIIDQADLHSPQAPIDRACRVYATDGAVVTPEARRTLLAVLAPQLQLVSSLARRIEEDAPVLLRLTEEQSAILDLLAEVPRIGVKGPAGTGKTVIAVEKARREAQTGKRVLLLCYNRPLADHLAAAAEGYTVKTFHGLCRDLAKAAGLRFDPPKGGDDQEFWETRAPELLMEALSIYPDERYDAVIVDEGQDFREYWWMAVEKLLKDRNTGTLWTFFDPQQNLFGGGPTDALGLQAATLTWNCRNTQVIAQAAFGHVGLTPRLKPGTPEGTAVREMQCANESEMVDSVRRTLHELVADEHVPSESIVVVTARSLESSPVWRAKRLGNLRLVEFPNHPGPGEIAMATLQRFKGLEADAVILCDVRAGDATCGPKHLYVGTSRARHILAVVRYA